jgi:hypothetical protein
MPQQSRRALAPTPMPSAELPVGYRRRGRAVPPGTWSPALVLQAMREWARTNGRAPRAEDWSTPPRLPPASRAARHWLAESSPWPCPTTVRRYFGSWSAALEQAGLRQARLAPWELSLPERVETARRLAAHGLPVAEIAQQLAVSATTVRVYLRARRCPGCRGPLVSPGARRCHSCEVRARRVVPSMEQVRAAQQAWAEDHAAIIAALRELGARTGRRPVCSDLQPKQTGLPTYSKTVAVFGSFAAALDAAGFPPRGRKWTQPEALTALQEWTAAHGRPPTSADWRCAGRDHPGSRVVHELFHGWSAALARAGLRRVWRREQILDALVQWASEHGRPPTGRDWQSPDPSGRRPSTQQVRHAFGCWSAALEAADLGADRGSRSGISRQAAGSASASGRARASVRGGRSHRSRAASGAGRAP